MDLPDIIEKGVNTRELFSIEILENGEYAAIRETEPKFFLTGPTIVETARKAENALDAYRQMKTKG